MIIKFLKRLWSLRPSEVKRVFMNVRQFKKCDGLKLAIMYGKLYYLENRYTNGQLDTDYRRKKVDEIIDLYIHPTDRHKYIDMLLDLRSCLNQANEDGLIMVGNNPSLSKQEAANYDKALDSLNYLITATRLYPMIWRTVFLTQY